jgi:hypothetical protein
LRISARKHWPKPVRPETDGFVANVDPALGQNIFDIAQRQRVSHVHQHDQADDLWQLLKYRNGLVIAQCQHGHSAPSFSSDTAHRTPKASVFAAQGLFRWLPRLVVMTNKVRIWRNAGEAARLGDFHV